MYKEYINKNGQVVSAEVRGKYVDVIDEESLLKYLTLIGLDLPLGRENKVPRDEDTLQDIFENVREVEEFFIRINEVTQNTGLWDIEEDGEDLTVEIEGDYWDEEEDARNWESTRAYREQCAKDYPYTEYVKGSTDIYPTTEIRYYFNKFKTSTILQIRSCLLNMLDGPSQALFQGICCGRSLLGTISDMFEYKIND